MKDREILIIDWNKVGREQLLHYCKIWNGEKLLFTKIIDRAALIAFGEVGEFARELEVLGVNVSRWSLGQAHPKKTVMCRVLRVIELRLQRLLAECQEARA